jgi:hypothetical protein
MTKKIGLYWKQNKFKIIKSSIMIRFPKLSIFINGVNRMKKKLPRVNLELFTNQFKEALSIII